MNAKDFRSELYNNYVSTFKGLITKKDLKSEQSYKTVFKKRYIPLLKDFSKEASVIDIGCGSGETLQNMKENGFQNLFGIDVSVEQIGLAKAKKLNVEALNIFDFFRTNKKKFDIIFALDIVEHFTKDEVIDLFLGFNSLLSKNGILIIHTPNGAGIFPNKNIYGDLTHQTIFTSNSLLQILKYSNFSEINFYESGPVAKNITGLLRVFLWKSVKIFFNIVRLIETGSKEKILTQDLICTARKF